MKNSGVEWIGEIPEDWDIYRNKNAFICNKEIVGKNSNSTQLLSLTTGGIKCKDINNVEGKLPESFDTYQYVKKNDVVMCLFDLDMSAVFSGISQYDGMISPAYKVLSCQDRANPLFIHYWFSYIFDGRKFNHYAKNIRYTLNYNEFATLPILLPPKSTQQRIASYLDKKCNKIEETIQNQQQVIEKLNAYKQSLITEAVTGKVKIENGKACGEYKSYKESGVEWIGKIPSGWISTRVGHLYKSMLGKMVCPNQLTEEHSLQKYLCAMNVHFDGVDLSEIKEMWFTPNEMNQYQVRNGDLLVVEGGAGAGGASIVYGLSENDKIFIQNSIHLVKPVKTNYLPKYLYYWIYSLVKQNYIDYTCNKATIPHFTKEKLEGMPIAISDKITQQEIIVYLDKKCTAIDTAIEQKQNLIEKLTEYKKSLIYEYVTGKKAI